MLGDRGGLEGGGKRSRQAYNIYSGTGGSGNFPGSDTAFESWTVKILQKFPGVGRCNGCIAYSPLLL